MLKSKILKLITVILLASFPLSVLAQAVDPNFNPDKLINDSAFTDTQTFGGPDGIQKFLESKNSVLADTDPSFLAKLNEPTITILKQGLDDPEPNLPYLRTAAQLIWDASISSGLNPQIILVTLNKEQGLVTSESDPNDPNLQTALDNAMGFACPDSTGCGDLFPGFYYQLFGNFDSAGNRYLGAAKSLVKSFTTTGGRGPEINGVPSQTGDTITLQNSLGGFDNVQPTQSVTLLNNATAALYRYTPHVFNGNYNFWRYFTAWFSYQNGSLLKLADSSDVYIIQNGLKELVPPFVATARALNLTDATVVSPDELNQYQTDQPYGPADGTIAEVVGSAQKYVFIDNTPHPASELVIKQRGLDPDVYYTLTSDESVLFPPGTVLPPTDGTIIRGTTNPAVYLVVNGAVKMYSAYTFAQNKITKKQIVTVPDAEIATYQMAGFVPPLDGSLVKGPANAAVYLVEGGLLRPITADIFKNQGYSNKQVATISAGEISGLTVGPYATPKDRTFFAVGSQTGLASPGASQGGPLFEFKNGSMDSISTFVAKQRGITPDYVFSSDMVSGWSTGISIPPYDGTLVKGDTDGTVFLVKNAQLDPLTAAAFKNHRYSAKNIKVLPQAEVDAYAKGDAITK